MRKAISCSSFRSWRKIYSCLQLNFPMKQTKTMFLVPELFSTAIQAMKDDPSETGYDVQKNPPDMRHAVCLEYRPVKKVLCYSLDLRLKNKSFQRAASGFRRDEEKDDKKRGAELTLREAMGNQQGLTQL